MDKRWLPKRRGRAVRILPMLAMPTNVSLSRGSHCRDSDTQDPCNHAHATSLFQFAVRLLTATWYSCQLTF
eukprot:1371071-Pleurochrysis_carterae.AAC.1